MCELEITNIQNGTKFDEKLVKNDNVMLKVRPELFREWDFEKNNELGLDVYSVSKGSGKKVWWKCNRCKSSYDVRVVDKVNKNYQCSYCAGRKVNYTNSLSVKNPKLTEEWHFTLNKNITPEDVTSNSNKKVWWKCVNNHEWEASINSRNQNGQGCPYCSGRNATKEDNLLVHYPELKKEWDYTKNKIPPENYKPYSMKKVWWKCLECKSCYTMVICDKTRNSQGCPYCSGHRKNETNSLESLNKDLAKEWHPIKNKDLTPQEVTLGCDKKVWWQGECGHEWESIISNRNKGSGCPYCAGVSILKGFNDMWTTNSELAMKLANPQDGYKYGENSNASVNWICPDCNHIIKNKKISEVNSQRLSCPKCGQGKSYPERIIYCLLLELELDFELEKTFKWSENKRYDYYLHSLNTIIEVHGEQHYTDNRFNEKSSRSLEYEQQNDRYKKELALYNGIINYLEIDARKSNFEYIVENVKKGFKEISINIENADWEKIKRESVSSFYGNICRMHNDGVSEEDIVAITKLTPDKVHRYLLKSRKDRLTGYQINERKSKEIVQLGIHNEYIKTWKSTKEAAGHYSISTKSIQCVCVGINKSANGYRWLYKEDYMKFINGELEIDFSKKTAKSVVQLSLDGEFIREWSTIREANIFYTGNKSSKISSCLKDINKEAYGYKWMYKEEYDQMAYRDTINKLRSSKTK